LEARSHYWDFENICFEFLKSEGTTKVQRHWTENWNKTFPERKLCGLNPNFYIYISVSDLYIPTIGLPFSLQENRWTDRGNILIAHRYMNGEIGNEAALFLVGNT
jgi:hypothetical protein